MARRRTRLIAIAMVATLIAYRVVRHSERGSPRVMPMAIDAGPLKGLAVFASDSIGQAYVTNRGGRVQSAIAVGTDFVLVPNKWERTMAPEDVQLAKDLHIPIGDGAELLRMADRQAKK